MSVQRHVAVTPLSPEHAAAARRLRVASEQYHFVGDIEFNLIDAEREPLSEAMLVLLDDRVVGCYRLDFYSSVVSRQTLGSNSVGLRGFAIDHRFQNQGIGTRALLACCDDVQARHPRHRLFALNVNCCNRAAIQTYRKAGFVETGEYYFGGGAGPQHLMLRHLHARQAMAPALEEFR